MLKCRAIDDAVHVPLDFSECSRVGLNYALGFALEFRSSLLLFHYVIPPTYALSAGHTALAGPKLITSQQEFAQDEMENLHRQLGKKSVEIEMLVGLGSPVEQINECIRAQASISLSRRLTVAPV
ncbi:MAG TPA: universal stress protein [Candidatus Udaeobacter sp.]|nr:universal stress protein [Candidatus Udaeobacter sp.]